MATSRGSDGERLAVFCNGALHCADEAKSQRLFLGNGRQVDCSLSWSANIQSGRFLRRRGSWVLRQTPAGVLRGRALKATHDEARCDMGFLRDQRACDPLSRAFCLCRPHGTPIHAGRSHPHLPQSRRAELFVRLYSGLKSPRHGRASPALRVEAPFGAAKARPSKVPAWGLGYMDAPGQAGQGRA